MTTRIRRWLEPLEDRTVPASLFADFNGDGFDDLAVGVPYANDNGAPDAGAVHVVYGSPTGLTADTSEYFTQDTLGVSAGEAFDQFGWSLAAGDFNGDGRDDLAVGTPGKLDDRGAVYVLYSSEAGLGGGVVGLLTQNTPGILDISEAGDRFGRSLAAGDFNGDGKDDLAVGVPFERYGAVSNAGAVNVIYGSAAGLTGQGSQFWTQASSGVADNPEPFDTFGVTLAAGDFNGDGKDDLAVGVPGEGLAGVSNAGAVHVLYGSAFGLSGQGSQFWTQNSYGVADTAETDDRFGNSLTAGDFNGDGRDDLAISVPFEDVGTAQRAGAVHVLYGGPVRLSAQWNQFWTQNTPGVADTAEADDYFGETLVAGDFNGDGRDDLAIGVPHEDIGTAALAGAVHVLYGSAGRLTATGDQFFTANVLAGGTVGADRFGGAVSAGDYNGDGKTDLSIGVPLLDVGDTPSAGGVWVVYGSRVGLDANGTEQLWTAFDLGFFGEDEDRFGFTL